MLDFRRQPGQSRGAYPDVDRALRTYWTVERNRASGLSLRASLGRICDNRAVSNSFGSAQYQHKQGREFDRLLAECWGALYPRLVAETMGWKV